MGQGAHGAPGAQKLRSETLKNLFHARNLKVASETGGAKAVLHEARRGDMSLYRAYKQWSALTEMEDQ